MNLATSTTTTTTSPAPFRLDYTNPANDPVLQRALWQIQEVKLQDIKETVTRHEGIINAEAWAWTILLKSGKYLNVSAEVGYAVGDGFSYSVHHSPAETPAKRRQPRNY
jgi:hypothetical protein